MTPEPAAGACAGGCCAPPGAGPDRRAVLVRRVRLLVAATITYNVVEAVVALTAGAAASSGALIGFGLDSVIEVASAAAVAWQFSGRDPGARERRALKAIAISFFALAIYVTGEAAGMFLTGASPETSRTGIVLAAISLAVMPVLSAAQRGAGREPGSAGAVADSRQTLLCTYLPRGCRRGCCSTPCSAGGGPTPASRSRSPRLPGNKAERPGAASIAADARQAVAESRDQYQCARPPIRRPVPPRMASATPATARMMPMVYSTGIPTMNPMIRRITPRTIT
jgi:hypothetical protein